MSRGALVVVLRVGLFVGFFGGLLAGPLAAASVTPPTESPPKIEVEIDPPNPEVGLVMTVTVSVSGPEGADCQMLDAPVVDGGRLTQRAGPSTSNMSFSVNGRRSSSITTRWQFELVPERVGDMLLPPFRFNCRGTEVASDERHFTVTAGSLIEDIVELSVTPSTTRLWVGQVLEVVVVASVLEDAWDLIPQRNGFDLALPWLDGVPGLHAQEIPSPQCNAAAMMGVNGGAKNIPVCRTRDFGTGQARQVFTGTIPLLATEPGQITLPSSRFGVRLVVERQVKRDPLDLLQMLGRRSVVPTRVMVTDATADAAVITVRPTPSEGRPASFTNAVGSFRIAGEARPSKLKVGESCRLSLVLELDDGRVGGNLSQVKWPEFGVLADGFRMFGKNERRDASRLVLELEVSPKTVDVDEIPALEFSAFNPLTERYETLTAGPFPLDVISGGEEGLAYLATPEEILNDLDTIRESLPAPAPPGLPVGLWPGLALLLVGLAELRLRRRGWKHAHPLQVARRGARRRLDRDLRAANGGKDVAAAFARYLAARLGGPPAGLTAEEAAEQVDDQDLARELRATVSGWEAAYLGGAQLETSVAAGQARALADRLEAAP